MDSNSDEFFSIHMFCSSHVFWMLVGFLLFLNKSFEIYMAA